MCNIPVVTETSRGILPFVLCHYESDLLEAATDQDSGSLTMSHSTKQNS